MTSSQFGSRLSMINKDAERPSFTGIGGPPRATEQSQQADSDAPSVSSYV